MPLDLHVGTGHGTASVLRLMRCRSVQFHIVPFRVKRLPQKMHSCCPSGVDSRETGGGQDCPPGMAACKEPLLATGVYGGGGVWITAASAGIGMGAGGLTGSCIIDAYHGFGAMVRLGAGGASTCFATSADGACSSVGSFGSIFQ